MFNSLKTIVRPTYLARFEDMPVTIKFTSTLKKKVVFLVARGSWGGKVAPIMTFHQTAQPGKVIESGNSLLQSANRYPSDKREKTPKTYS